MIPLRDSFADLLDHVHQLLGGRHDAALNELDFWPQAFPQLGNVGLVGANLGDGGRG